MDKLHRITLRGWWRKAWGAPDAPRETARAEFKTSVADYPTHANLEVALARSNRALRAIHDCEDVISEINEEDALLQAICGVVTSTGYPMAWAGILKHDGAIVPIGLTLEHKDYLDALRVPLQSGGKGTHAITRVLKTGRPATVNYFANDTAPTPWREEAIRRGFYSKLVLPITEGDTVIGIFNVYATEPDAFDPQEVALLFNLVQRVAGKIHSYRERYGRQTAETALHLRKRAIECSANAVIISNASQPHFPIEYVNPAFERITGYSAAEVTGKSPGFLLLDDREQPGLVEIRAAIAEKREGQAVVRNYRKDGSLFWNDMHIAPVRDESGIITHFVAGMSDITPIKQYETTLQRMANYDSLTGLPNRALLQERLEAAIAESADNGASVWAVLLDLDRFKFVNDTMGHQAGDDLLKIVATRLQNAARDSDTVARLGGDEFVLLLPEKESNGAANAASVVQRIMKAAAEPFVLQGRELFLSCSVGIAVYPSDGSDAKTLMAHADVAMYQAKKHGANTFELYTKAMNSEALERLRFEGELRQAIERQEFVLHYQPQINLRSGEIVGLEALIRWNHPELGMIFPDKFIGLAEETGLIVPIGAWVLETACEQAQAWHAQGFAGLRMAINLSARQFTQATLLNSIAASLQQTGLTPDCLEIELTESSVMNDIDRNIQTLHGLKALGVKLSIDDFGTGHSSLAYLKRFPIDTLKIDRSFVQDISTSRDDASIVFSIISLAHNLRLNVIAEGVETATQMAILREQRCDEIQGYYFYKPLPSEEITALLAKKLHDRQHERPASPARLSIVKTQT